MGLNLIKANIFSLEVRLNIIRIANYYRENILVESMTIILTYHILQRLVRFFDMSRKNENMLSFIHVFDCCICDIWENRDIVYTRNMKAKFPLKYFAQKSIQSTRNVYLACQNRKKKYESLRWVGN